VAVLTLQHLDSSDYLENLDALLADDEDLSFFDEDLEYFIWQSFYLIYIFIRTDLIIIHGSQFIGYYHYTL
jgi:hypothetical protein